MEEMKSSSNTVPAEFYGRTALEMLAQPVLSPDSNFPPPTPLIPFDTDPKPTPPDHTGYPDVTPPDQEYLQE